MRQQEAEKHALQPGMYPDFADWIRSNWAIYEEFERYARYAAEKGRSRLSAKLIFEQIRWNTMMREDGPYKINNVYASSCARLFDLMNPALAGRFEFRERQHA